MQTLVAEMYQYSRTKILKRDNIEAAECEWIFAYEIVRYGNYGFSLVNLKLKVFRLCKRTKISFLTNFK